MKITFFSNFLNHHQLPFCQEMIKLHGDDFKFVATEEIPKERIKLGYEDMNNKYDFVIKSYENEKEAYFLANESDVVIIGSAPEKYIKKRKKDNKLIFRYSERIFKSYNKIKNLKSYISIILRRTLIDRRSYLLCASAFAAHDYNIAGAYINRCFKWGYFPKVKRYENLEELIKHKEKNNILWVGRFLDWKHPELVIELAKRLKARKYKFKITMIGEGNIKEKIVNMVKKYSLEDVIEILDSMSPDKIRAYMEKSQIYLFTSDKGEGWGAVLNEAMNSACAVVASSQIGSVPFLIHNKQNGLIYRENKIGDLVYNVENLLNNEELCQKIGEKAYETMINEWSPEEVANRITNISEHLLNSKSDTIYQSGPCSIAKNILNSWY